MNGPEDSQPRATPVNSLPVITTVFLATVLLLAATLNARSVEIERTNPALKFTYSWPADADAVPRLDQRFRAEAATEYRRHLKMGRENKKIYRQQQRGSVSDYYSKKWTSAGQTARLLSLRSVHSTYTGGAHPNTDFGALLWDRKLDRPISVGALFLNPDALTSLTSRSYCAALNKERLARRQGAKRFDECPIYNDLAIAPVDRNRNGRFDAIALEASPYVAGPYAEGEYEIILPVTRQLVVAMKPGYRASFEARRQ